MARQLRPQIQKKFGGLFTADHPLARPPQSASRIDNFDVLPGNWLRMCSGRIGRVQATSADGIPMLMPTSLTQVYGSAKHLVQINYNSGAEKIVELTIASNGTFTLDEGSAVETLNDDIDPTAVSRGVAWAQLPNSIVYHNGYATRLESPLDPIWLFASHPGLSQWKPDGSLRYFGLLPIFTPNAGLGPLPPAITFTAGAGFNEVTTSVNIWAGLYNSATEHYSNAIFCGAQTPTGSTGTIKVTNLASVAYAYHSTDEQNELYWVFYASLDGFETAYLIFDSALEGPHKVSVTDASIATGVSLSIADDTDNGWVLDSTKERPVNNYPPRTMSSLCYTNGRLYGILSPTKEENNPIFSEYVWTEKELSGVVWSESEGTQRTTDFLGDPLQSWNPKNFSPVQAGQYPRVVFPAPESSDVMVLSATHTWLLREEADRFHRWISASDQHGINSMLDAANSHKCITKTRHGVAWVTQRNQLAILETGSEKVKILSADYPDAIPAGDGTVAVHCVTYIYDPINQIDRIDVHFSALISESPRNPFLESTHVYRILRHDFANGTSTVTQDGITQSAAPMVGGDGQTYHVLVKQLPGVRTGLYSVEGQPDHSFRIPTKNETFQGAASQTKLEDEQISGIWISQWLDFGDCSKHGEVPHIDILGDVAESAQLGASPLAVRYFNGFTTAVSPSTGTLITGYKTVQELGDFVYRYDIQLKHKRFWKFCFELSSHSEDFGDYFLSPAKEGDQAGDDNFFEAIMIMMPTVGRRENRD